MTETTEGRERLARLEERSGRVDGDIAALRERIEAMPDEIRRIVLKAARRATRECRAVQSEVCAVKIAKTVDDRLKAHDGEARAAEAEVARKAKDAKDAEAAGGSNIKTLAAMGTGIGAGIGAVVAWLSGLFGGTPPAAPGH